MKDQNGAAMAATIAALVTVSGVASAQSLAHEIHETIMQDLMENELWQRSGDELSLADQLLLSLSKPRIDNAAN